MIRRIDRIQTELPPPSDPDPAGAAAVQELLGGKFGEMSTFLNYTFQSFNFRNNRAHDRSTTWSQTSPPRSLATSSSSLSRSTRC
jgi:Mn-containing catalase